MYNQDAFNTFVTRAKECNLAVLDNGEDLLIYPNISQSVSYKITINFNIEIEEVILYIRDASFWNDRNQGFVVTDWGIYHLPDNDKPNEIHKFGWGEIDHVEYINQWLVFFFPENIDEHLDIPINHILKDTDDDRLCKQNGEVLADIFSEMAENSVDLCEEAYRQIDLLMDEEKYSEAITLIKQCLNTFPDEKPFLCSKLADCYRYLKDYTKAISACDAGMKGLDKTDPKFVFLSSSRYLACAAIENYEEARKYALIVAMYENDLSQSKVLADNNFSVLTKKYAEHFLEMPYQQRKILMVVDSYSDLFNKHIQVIDTDIAAYTKINFPLGHPRSKQIYIGHPLIPNKYIPLESYQLEFVEDKIREFCLLAQNLGATEISISAHNSTISSSKQSGTRNVSMNINHWAIDASGSLNNEFSAHLIEELGKNISLHQTFRPHSKPVVPEGLVWYQNEPSWQRLASQRINGNLLSHEERIETRKSQMVESREMSEIKGEFETLLLDVGVKMGKTDERQFQMQENAILSIKVIFAPLSQLNNSNSKMINSTQKPQTPQISSNPNNKNEEEYLENYVDILADYGEIGQRERKRLEKDRVRLGISEARAKELEAGWEDSTLSKEEKEYLEEFKEMLEDYGSISDRERKRLDKTRARLGISKSRAAEIEKMS